MLGGFFLIKDRILKLAGANFADKTKLILDLGCGNKPYYHNNVNGKLVCFDIKKTKINDVIGDASSLPFKNNAFDVILSINSFYYFNNPFISVKEVSRILKKNGKFILIMPFIYPIHDAPDDKYRFTEFGIKSLLEDDFAIKELQCIGGIFNLPAVIMHSLLKGFRFMPKPFKIISIPLTIVLYPIYMLAQVFSLLDFFDRTGRWPTYYFVLAAKK